jgi:hypothetical protein
MNISGKGIFLGSPSRRVKRQQRSMTEPNRPGRPLRDDYEIHTVLQRRDDLEGFKVCIPPQCAKAKCLTLSSDNCAE